MQRSLVLVLATGCSMLIGQSEQRTGERCMPNVAPAIVDTVLIAMAVGVDIAAARCRDVGKDAHGEGCLGSYAAAISMSIPSPVFVVSAVDGYATHRCAREVARPAIVAR
jgi:hypothetical protein